MTFNTKSQRGVIWACVLCGLWGISPCVLSQESNSVQSQIDAFCGRYGMDVKKTNDEGETLLHLAVKKEVVGVVQFLVERGADINAKSSNGGWTPLHNAAFLNTNPEVIKFLIEKGAEVNAKSDTGWTPLHSAASNENPEVIKILIENDADVNAKNSFGCTPLHVPSDSWYNPEIIKLLINKRTAVNAKSNGGETPLQLARSTARTNCGENCKQPTSSIKRTSWYKAKQKNRNG